MPATVWYPAPPSPMASFESELRCVALHLVTAPIVRYPAHPFLLTTYLDTTIHPIHRRYISVLSASHIQEAFTRLARGMHMVLNSSLNFVSLVYR